MSAWYRLHHSTPSLFPDLGLLFYCQIKEGMEREVLKATDIVSQTWQAIEARGATGVPISGMIDLAVNGRANALVTFNLRDYGTAATRFGVEVLLPREAIGRITQ
jgi:hypothetical protein